MFCSNSCIHAIDGEPERRKNNLLIKKIDRLWAVFRYGDEQGTLCIAAGE